MKLLSSPFVSLLVYCATQCLGVQIHSVPDSNSEGVVHTELNQTVSLTCRPVADSDTDEELVWLRNGAAVKLTDRNKKGSSSVCVSPASVDDDGATFSCHLRKNASMKASVTLSVTHPPALSGYEEVMVEEEATLTLRCEIFANPPVSSVQWMLNGSQVDLLASGFSVTSDGLASWLTADEVEMSLHEGVYQCNASSPMYGLRSRVFRVTVTEKTFKFPLMPMIAGIVVVCLTSIFAVLSRWKRITKCCK